MKFVTKFPFSSSMVDFTLEEFATLISKLSDFINDFTFAFEMQFDLY